MLQKIFILIFFQLPTFKRVFTSVNSAEAPVTLGCTYGRYDYTHQTDEVTDAKGHYGMWEVTLIAFYRDDK